MKGWCHCAKDAQPESNQQSITNGSLFISPEHFGQTARCHLHTACANPLLLDFLLWPCLPFLRLSRYSVGDYILYKPKPVVESPVSFTTDSPVLDVS